MSTVVDKAGLRGRMTDRTADGATVALPDGARVRVPIAWLQQRGDAYHLPVSFQDLRARGEVSEATIPLAQESLDVGTRAREHVVRLRKVVREHDERVSQALAREDVEIERVPVNRPVDGPVSAREDGDTLIVPLLEEEIVWRKQLVLREELHIRKRRRTESTEVTVPLRHEELVVEREEKKP